MNIRKKSNFSVNGEYFALSNEDGSLKIFETSTNTVKRECILNSSTNYRCSSLIWGPTKHEVNLAERKKIDDKSFTNAQYLIIGTEGGQILLYDFIEEKFYNHFITSHSDAVNDLFWHSSSNRLFSCSTDKSIGVWDITSTKNTKVKLSVALFDFCIEFLSNKWEADNEPLNSICVIDNENLLAASTSITWWNIKEQTIIKKFDGHNSEIFALLPVISTDVSSNSYFLSAAVGDSKINAWHLNVENSKHSVASFNIQGDLESLDPMYLSAIIKEGPLLLFKHVLNGRPKKNLEPQKTLHILSNTADSTKPSITPIIASRFSEDLTFCTIAYGSYENPIFEKMKIDDFPKTLTLCREKPLLSEETATLISEVKMYNKLGEYISANGTLILNSKLSTPKKKKQKDPDLNTPCKEIEESVSENENIQSPIHRREPSSSPNVKKTRKSKQSVSPERNVESFTEESFSNPSNVIDNLSRCLQTEDKTLLNMVLKCDDEELIESSVKKIPENKLKFILQGIYNIVTNQQNRLYAKKWLKKILSIHLRHIMQCEDLKETIDLIENYFNQQRFDEKGKLLLQLESVLSLLIQNEDSDTIDSDTDKEMET
ncbi:WD repeat-containing protein 43 [Caerostris extrusa]|uniref:WD repeat-containing protein 43 n=1 Tax=Caerostris extrusa TaxID=172846 RepID=A0AAV4UQU3_CAEEX|nr:WD repeat-containing protein 43 [Caerostris extrusa]